MNPTKKRDKIDPESDANSNSTTFYFTLQNNIVFSLSKMPQSMIVKQLNLDYSCFKFHADR